MERAAEVMASAAQEDVNDAKSDEKRQKAQETLDHLKQLEASL